MFHNCFQMKNNNNNNKIYKFQLLTAVIIRIIIPRLKCDHTLSPESRVSRQTHWEVPLKIHVKICKLKIAFKIVILKKKNPYLYDLESFWIWVKNKGLLILMGHEMCTLRTRESLFFKYISTLRNIGPSF